MFGGLRFFRHSLEILRKSLVQKKNENNKTSSSSSVYRKYFVDKRIQRKMACLKPTGRVSQTRIITICSCGELKSTSAIMACGLA